MIYSVIAGIIMSSAFIVDQNTLFPASVIFVIGGSVVWLSRKLQSLDDKMEMFDKRMDERDVRFDRIETILQSLPCKNTINCVPPTKK